MLGSTSALIEMPMRTRDTTASTGWLSRALLLVVLATLPYANALSTGFTFDDEFQIRTNPAVVGRFDVWTILSMPLPPGSVHRPFTVLTFALNEVVAPGDARLFHAVNVFLHVLVTLLVAWLAQRLFARPLITCLAGAVFAVHPVHTEAVTSVVGRAEELAALLGLLTLFAAVRADSAAGAWPRRAWSAASLLAFGLAVMSKESALTVLPLVFLLRPTLRGESWRVGLIRELRGLDWIPYLLVAAIYLVLRQYVAEVFAVAALDNMLVTVPTSVRLASALGVLWDYFAQLLAPVMLSADYSHPQVAVLTSWLAPRCLGGIAVVAAIALTAALARRPLAFVAVFPLITLALTANLLFAIGTIRGERLLYLPSVGWSILVAALAVDAARRLSSRLVLGLVMLWVVALAGRTWLRNPVWADDFTLHQQTVADAPFSAKARLNYGIALQRAGQTQAALAQFQRSLELFPAEEAAANGIGRSLEASGRSQEAVQWYEKAVEIDPAYRVGYVNLCRARLARGEFAAAERACRRGLRVDPGNSDLLKGLGVSLIKEGERAKGLAVLQGAASLNPRDPEIDRLRQLAGESPAVAVEAVP